MFEVLKPFQTPALISAGVLFLSYVVITLYMFGVSKSISWTYYLLKDSDKKRGLWKREYWFQLFIYLLSIFIVIAGNNIYFLIAGLLLSIVGLAPTVKNKYILMFHSFGAFSSIIICYINSFTISCILPTLVACVWTIYFYVRKGSYIYYLEVASFIIILLQLSDKI